MNPETLPTWTAVAALGALASAAVAAVYTAITMSLVRIQSDPKVIVYVRHDAERPSVFVITIENVGRDIARDVRFTASRPLPAKAYGISVDQAPDAPTMDKGPLITGIPALGPGDRRDITWGQFGGLSKALSAGPIHLEYSYGAGRRRLHGSATLEVMSYTATDASTKPIVSAAKSLREIATSARAIVATLPQIHASDRVEESDDA